MFDELNKVSGIYCFENKIDGKKYIGKSIDLKKRILDHLNSLNKNSDDCTYLQNAWNKYSENNFEIYVLDKNIPKEELSDLEVYYIKNLNSKRPNGYNLTDGGDGSFGYTHSEETKHELSNIRKEYYKNNDHHLLGKHHSEKTKNKLSEALFGRKATKETKEKLSEIRSGKNHYFFGKKKNFSSGFLGVYLRDEKWIARIKVNGKSVFIGTFSDELDAALSYDKYIIENNLNNKLNFPELMSETASHISKTKSKESSEYLGVSFQKNKNKWCAFIYLDGKSKYIGIFEEEIAAAIAYDDFIIENKINKKINFPERYTR